MNIIEKLRDLKDDLQKIKINEIKDIDEEVFILNKEISQLIYDIRSMMENRGYLSEKITIPKITNNRFIYTNKPVRGENRVLRYIEEGNDNVSVDDVGSSLGINRTTAYTYLRNLTKEGYLNMIKKRNPLTNCLINLYSIRERIVQ